MDEKDSLKFIGKKCNTLNNLWMKKNFLKFRDENKNGCKL